MCAMPFNPSSSRWQFADQPIPLNFEDGKNSRLGTWNGASFASPPLSVACNYRIGTTEVTNSPYVESLKPKAAEQFLGSLQHGHGRRYPNPPAALADEFRKYYGPTMNAFEAAEKNGRAADLPKELAELFNRQNQCPRKDATSILATFLRDTVAL